MAALFCMAQAVAATETAPTPPPAPAYAAPLTDVFESPEPPGTPLALFGVDLAQGGVPLTGDRPELRSAGPLTITAYWVPRVRLASPAPILIRFWDHLNLIRRDFEFQVGPDRGTTPWEAGSIYRAEYPVPMAEVAAAFSGKAYLSINLRPAPAQPNVLRPLQLIPVVIEPEVVESQLAKGALLNHFGPNHRAIPVASRLGAGAAVSIPIPPELRAGYRRIALVTTLSYRSPAQGAVVCKATLRDGAGHTQTLEIRAGAATARCDWDSYGAARMNHERAHIFSSRDSAHLDPSGRPIQLHAYTATWDVAASLEGIVALDLECTADTVFELYGIVLLPDPA